MSGIFLKLTVLVAGVLVSIGMYADSIMISVAEKQKSYASIIERSRTLIEKEMSKDKDIAGLSIVLVDNEGAIWSEGFGWASKIDQRALTSDTAMMVGSVSKVFTAIAVMQLVEQGKIDLDRAFVDYVPEFLIQRHNAEWPAVTIRHMLTHRSGVPDEHHQGLFDDPFDSEKMSYMALPEALSGEFLISRPGHLFAYANIPFSLLSVLVEKLSGEVFPEYVQNHILTPLGMGHSSFLPDVRVSSRLAKGFRDSKTELDYPYFRDIGAGSLAATADDMGKFMIALLNDGAEILQPQSLQEMFRQQNAGSPLDGPIKVGLSFFINDLDGKINARRNISHAGGLEGHQALMVSLPDDDLAIAVMTNSNAGMKLIYQLADDVLAAAYHVKTGETLPEIEKPKTISLSQKQLGAYVGYYVTPYDADVLWRIYTKKGKFLVRAGSTTLELVPHEGGVFSLQYKLFGFIPLDLEELRDVWLHGAIVGDLPHFWLNTLGVFLSPVDPVPVLQSWKDLVGEYKVDNLNDESVLKESGAVIKWDKKSGFLLINGRPVRTINDRYAVYMGNARGFGGTIERLSGDRLYYSGLIYSRK
ncbi:hypothetical protein MNBD_GAMMA26-364 [hydrothermal vent metagenome]|uniref:Beta-lactamase-related domain-containing protein n=1 Tax=hydrothermal vent metagenome TaxID=652676 RepID=A0A3B1BFT3_9ZZZZ